MTGKQILLTASALLLISLNGSAQVKDSISTNIRDYNDELGFYQRANRDPGDPRFMFYDETAGLNFGIGGTAKVTSYYGFLGSVSQSIGSKFRSSAISVPTDKAPVFSNGISASEIHAKARANWKGHKMIAFLRMAGADDGNVKLNQAYISIDGLSFGLIPSFFMDMEAGVMTAGIGPDAQVEHASSLVGYTHRFSKNWSFAIAAEHASLDLSHYDRDVDGVATDFQPVPDFSSRLKYRWGSGHFQVAALCRNLTYWAVPEGVKYYAQGENRHCLGYGLAFSGNYKPVRPLKFSWQFVGGKGVASYLSDFAAVKVDLGLAGRTDNGLRLMEAIPVASGVLATQYDWGNRFSASLQLSRSQCFRLQEVQNHSLIKKTWTASANFLWNMSDYAYFGIEYLYGYRGNYEVFGTAGHMGEAHRVGGVLAFFF